MVAATVLILSAIFVTNSRNALHPESLSAVKIDTKKVVQRIEKAGLVPTEARYYRKIQ
jgi:hypothetical protein